MNRETKWIFSRHTKDIDALITLAKDLKRNEGLMEQEKKLLLTKLKEKGIYKERFNEPNLSTLMNKISDLNFYMFGYKEKINNQLKFLFSPLGNLFLKYETDVEKKQKIFASMLWGLQFKHPHNNTNEKFNLYPFRLIFNLLLDVRLENKLFTDEVSYIIMFIEEIKNERDYENVVETILKFRQLDNETVKNLFLKDDTTNLVNAVYEWDYYVKHILIYLNIIDSVEGELIIQLKHGESSSRKLKKSYIKIKENLSDFIIKLNIEKSLFEIPIDLKSESFLSKDIKKEIYNFCPKTLLNEINDTSFNYELLELPKLINKFAENPGGIGYDKFETILEESFNLFYNVEAKKISGPGCTDVECLYLNLNKKFAVEAKSTKNKLTEIRGRLNEHLRLIGGKYTIVITPRYAKVVLKDIEGTNIVILLANTFSEFLYNNLIIDNRKIDFKLFDEIIEKRLGSDISEDISKMTLEKFANI